MDDSAAFFDPEIVKVSHETKAQGLGEPLPQKNKNLRHRRSEGNLSPPFPPQESSVLAQVGDDKKDPQSLLKVP